MSKEQKIDLRKVGADELYRIRCSVLRMHKGGVRHGLIAANLNICDRYVRKILGQFGDKPVAKTKVRGRKLYEKRKLSISQEREIRQLLVDKKPEQFKLGFMLWTRRAVCLLIKDKYGIELSERLASEYLRSWGLTCQRPSKRACEQDIIKVNHFKEVAYPAIKVRAKAQNAEIYWGDETCVSNQENFERGFSPKGVAPVLVHQARKESVSMISAINNRGHHEFMLLEKAIDKELFIEFLQRLVSSKTHKIFLIVDNLRVHHSKLVSEWLSANQDKIELYFIPPYSPELNPDEYLNNSLKHAIHSNDRPRTKPQLAHKVTTFMNSLTPQKISKLFDHKKLTYLHS